MIVDYIENFRTALELCEEFEKRVTQVFFQDGIVNDTSENLANNIYYCEIISPIESCLKLYCIFCPHHLGKYEPFVIEVMQDLVKPKIPIKLQAIKNDLGTLKTAFTSAKREMEEIGKSFDEERNKG